MIGENERVRGSLRAGVRAAAFPIGGLMLTYVAAMLTPWGRSLDRLASHGRYGSGWSLSSADLVLLELISTATLTLALVVLVLVSGIRKQWGLGLRGVLAVVGSILSAETLKHVLPSQNRWSEDWSWFGAGTFPSGHAVVVTSLSLAVLSIASDGWRRRLIGPLAAATAIVTTATVTVGWHRPSDVLGSLFLATAWHQLTAVGAPADRRLRTMLLRVPLAPSPRWSGRWRGHLPTALWWAAASVLVLGAAIEGSTWTWWARLASTAYVGSLTVLLAGVLVTITLAHQPAPAGFERGVSEG